jgi:DNA-binding LytR/AlgR family response regulator
MGILIVEDDIIIANHIREILLKAGYKDCKVAYNKDMAKELLTPDIELALLDIRMSTDDGGIRLAEFINAKLGIPFVFITANIDKNSLPDILSVSPVSYINKPFTELELLAAVHIALQREPSDKSGGFLILKDGYKMLRIFQNDISYIKSDGNYARVVTKNKKYLLRYSLEWLLTQLNPETFYRTHRACIVNINHVDEVQKKSLRINDEELPISRAYQATINKVIANL